MLLVICEKKNLRTFVNTFVLCIEKGRQNCDFEDSEQMVVKESLQVDFVLTLL